MRREKRVGRKEKGCEKGQDTPLSNPAKVFFKFTHRTMTSMSFVKLSIGGGGGMAGLYAVHVFASLSLLVVCVEVYGPADSWAISG